MAFRFDRDREHGILRVAVEGRLDDAALSELYRTVGERFVRSGARAAILDLTAVTDFAVTTRLIEQLSRAPTALPELQTPRFIVAPQTHVFATMRMFQLIGEPTRPGLLVVRTPQEAYAALQVESPAFERWEE